MSILWTAIKFLALLFVVAFVVNTIIRAVATMLIAHAFYSKRLKHDPNLSRISVGEPFGLPVAAFFTAAIAVKGLAWLGLGRVSYIAMFACLIGYAALSYGNTRYSNMPRSSRGFAGELLVYVLFLVNPVLLSFA